MKIRLCLDKAQYTPPLKEFKKVHFDNQNHDHFKPFFFYRLFILME